MDAPANETTIALVDDHVVMREGLREILQAEDDLTVIGEAGDSASAVTLVERAKPDIVLLDVEIPGDEVLTTVRRMRSASPASKVVILSMYDGPKLLRSLLALGIKGYLLKSVTRHELVAAMRGARTDDGRVLLSVSSDSLAKVQAPEPTVLTDREQDILELVACAMSNAQIATRLDLSEATVKRHMRNIFAKLDAVSRIDAVNKAITASLIDARS